MIIGIPTFSFIIKKIFLYDKNLMIKVKTLIMTKNGN